jgi:chromosome segregation ATPase
MDTNQTPDIADALKAIDTKLDALKGIDTRLTSLEADVKIVVGLGDRVTGLEKSVAGLGTAVATLQTQMVSLETQVTSLDTKVTSLDTRVTDVQTGLINLSLEMKRGFAKVDRRFTSMAAQIEGGRAEIVSHIDRVYDEVASRLKDVEGPSLH